MKVSNGHSLSAILKAQKAAKYTTKILFFFTPWLRNLARIWQRSSTGLIGFMTLWVVIGIALYGFDDRDDGNQESASADLNVNTAPLPKAILGFLSLVVIDLLHAGAFFTLLKNIGAVASALLKGVQAIVVIALSAIFYCPTEESQCLTTMKAISAMTVMSGVVGYGIGSSISSGGGGGGGRGSSDGTCSRGRRSKVKCGTPDAAKAIEVVTQETTNLIT